jgi:CheY-like chemotaxis protein
MEDGAREWEILLVEDNPADIRLTQEALKELRIRHRLQVAEDGGAALSYLEGTCDSTSGRLPDLILLDINLPVMNGLEVLAVIKASDRMKSIPVIIMSSSAAESDVATAYRLNANCYTKKPLELDGFFEVMDSIRHFWLETALLPGRTSSSIH